MKRQRKLRLRRWLGQGLKRPVRHRPLTLEHLEDRSLPSAAGPFQHVLLLSVDGVHQADVADPALHGSLTNIRSLQQQGVTYTNASTTQPSDSFPGTLSYLTGAHPGTTGVFYDDSYSRTLFAPGSNVATAKPGTEVTYFEAIDKNQGLISGGGNFDASSIDPGKLPLDSKGNPVYPNQFLQVNTIFDVAHQAGLYTAFSDKHPAYQIANGNDPSAINDFYGPEINSTTARLDPTTGHTDASIGRFVRELEDRNLYYDTLLVVTAKHGQDPRVGNGQLLADSLVPNVLAGAGVTVAQQTADDVSLVWLADQKQTDKGADALEHFRTHGTVDVYKQGVKSTVPASQVIDKVLSGEALQDCNLGNPRKDSTTPDVVVTLKPGYLFVGNPLKYQFKRAEHGGFSADDTHDALIVGSPGLDPSVQGTGVGDPVQTTQIAVTALEALGLDREKLQGAEAEGTQELPGLKLEAVVGRHEDGQAGLQQIDHFVVIYQENWSFDALYGSFPGANGLQNAAAAGTIPQVDVNGKPLTFTPSPLNNGKVDPNFPSVIINGQSYYAGQEAGHVGRLSRPVRTALDSRPT